MCMCSTMPVSEEKNKDPRIIRRRRSNRNKNMLLERRNKIIKTNSCPHILPTRKNCQKIGYVTIMDQFTAVPHKF